MLLMPPFDVPDAFDALVDELPGSVVAAWPPAASAEIPAQESVGLPVVRELLEGLAGPPRAVVALEGAVGLALAVGREHPAARVVLVDPRPFIPGMPVDWSVLPRMADQVPGMDEMFERMAEAEQRGAPEELRVQIYLDHLERRLLPAIEDAHERRWATSRLAVMRRDGVRLGGEVVESPLAPWYEQVLDDGMAVRTTVVLTTTVTDVAESIAEHYRSQGIRDVVLAPLPSAWWWSATDAAADVFTELTA